MKIKKSYIIGAVVVLLLAVFIIMGVTRPDDHAGHDHGNTQSTVDDHAGHDHTTQSTVDDHAGHDHATQPDNPTGADLSPDKAYTLKKNDNGTYTATVKGRSGTVFYTSKDLQNKPTFTEVNQDVLEIADRSAKNKAANWAVFCDIQNYRVSKKYTFVLATLDSHVAYVDHRSGKFHVFVSDVFDENVYLEGYALEGAALTSSGSPEVSYKLNGSTLTVTYSTEDGTNSIDIKMFA